MSQNNKLLLKEFLPALAAVAEPVVTSMVASKLSDKLGEEKETDLEEESDVYEALGEMIETQLGEDGYPDPDQWPSTEKPVYPRVVKQEGMDVRDETSLKRDASGIKSEDGYPDPDQWPSTEKPVYPRVVKEELPGLDTKTTTMTGMGRREQLKAMMPKLMQLLTSMDQNTLQQVSGMMPRIISMKQNRIGESHETPVEEAKKEVKESKKITSKKQLKEALVESLIISKKKSLVDRIVKEQLNEQAKVLGLTKSLLTEGPLSSMWQGLKGAGRGLVGGAKGAVQGAQQAMAQGAAQDQGKQAQKTVIQALKTVEKTRGKFNQETMKSADLVSQYHDAVVNLVNVLNQVKGMVGPMELAQLKNDVDQSVGQLYNDLVIEKQGVEGFLKSLQQAVPGSLAAGAKSRQIEKTSADQARAAAAPAKLPGRMESKSESKKSKSKSKK